MKIAKIKNYGGSDVIEIVDEEVAKPAKGEVLIKVFAASVNPFDLNLMKGIISSIKINFPFAFGGDFAGVIAQVGEGVDGFSVGNKVYGSSNFLAGGTGAFAEFTKTKASMIAKMSNNTNFDEAASVVLTGASAVQVLLDHMKLKQGQKILIHGGAGGIGTMAIQIAKYLGALVATTATGDGLSYVRELGADYVIDYKKEDFSSLLSDYDAVFDTVGGETFERSFKVLRKGGIIVSMVAKDEKNMSEQYGVTAISQFTKVNRESLDKLTGFLESKKVKPHIDKIFSFDNIKEAFEEQEKGGVLGKIVIEIHPG